MRFAAPLMGDLTAPGTAASPAPKAAVAAPKVAKPDADPPWKQRPDSTPKRDTAAAAPSLFANNREKGAVPTIPKAQARGPPIPRARAAAPKIPKKDGEAAAAAAKPSTRGVAPTIPKARERGTAPAIPKARAAAPKSPKKDGEAGDFPVPAAFSQRSRDGHAPSSTPKNAGAASSVEPYPAAAVPLSLAERAAAMREQRTK